MQHRHEKIIYENDRGQRVEIAYSFPYFFQSITGVDGIDAEITKIKSVGQDGVTITNVSLPYRPIRISGSLKGSTKEEIARLRAELFKIFNPKIKGTLQYEYGETKKQIRCQVETGPVFKKKGKSYQYQDFIIDLICPVPFWFDEFETGKEIVTWIGGISFPLILPTTFAMKGPKKINIINNGDVETPVRIEFRGPATNPRITNITTGEYIQVNRTILANDILVITTDFGNKRVEINGQNVFNWIDVSSVFWQLEVGDNVVEYSSDDEVEPASVKISYRNRYIGV